MIDPFSLASANINGPAIGAMVITPSDGSDLSSPVRAITIGGGDGTLAYIGWDGVPRQTGVLPSGCTYPVLVRRVLATGTTATGLTGWI